MVVLADHREKLKGCEKKGTKNLSNMKVAVIPVVIGALGTILKGLIKVLKDLERGKLETMKDYGIIKNNQNTEKSPRNLRGIVVTSVRYHKPTPVWKTH